MEFDDINFDRILLDRKSYANILVYNILYKKYMEANPLRNRFNKADGITKIYDGIRYLELSNSYIVGQPIRKIVHLLNSTI